MPPNALAALFLPRRRLATAERTLLQRGGPLGGSQWVAPRGQCQYRQQDFSAVPKRQRREAAALYAQRLMPNVESRARIGWMDGIAHFWIWEKPFPAAVKGRQRWVPESVLRRPPLADGVHLLKCVSGVEGQIWQGGRLLASQWWLAAPTLENWQRFLRGAGASGGAVLSQKMPAVQDLPWLAYPWALMQSERSGRFAGSEYVIWVGVMALLAAAAGWQLASLDQWKKLRESQSLELETLRARAAPILAAREGIDETANALAKLTRLQTDINDYDLIADVVAPMPKGSRVTGWMRDTGKIEVMLKTTLKSPVEVVQRFRGHPLLRDVTATPGEGMFKLEFALPKPPSEEAVDSDPSTSESTAP